MKMFYIEFEGYCAISANNQKEARKIFEKYQQKPCTKVSDDEDDYNYICTAIEDYDDDDEDDYDDDEEWEE